MKQVLPRFLRPVLPRLLPYVNWSLSFLEKSYISA